MRFLNMPPVWLVAFMVLVWFLRHAAGWPWIGGAIMALGLGLAVWAALVFARARTTIVPREEPSALVTAGPYRFSRNPIYLADCVVLAGWCIAIGAFAALPLAVALAAVLDRLFIRPEERMLEEKLGAPFRAYRARVRRWL